MNPSVILQYVSLDPMAPRPDYGFVFDDVPVDYPIRRTARSGTGGAQGAQSSDCQALGLVLLDHALRSVNASQRISALKRLSDGKPVIPGEWHFSISHSATQVGVLLSRAPVGFDWEPRESVVEGNLRLWNGVRRPAEATTPTQAWVAMEAVLKAHGGGLKALHGLEFNQGVATVGHQRYTYRWLSVESHIAAMASEQILVDPVIQKLRLSDLPNGS